MLLVWMGCIVAFYVLPFQLEDRFISLYGLLILLVFLAVYCLGAGSASRIIVQRAFPSNVGVDFRLTDRILVLASLTAVAASLFDVQGRDLFNLGDSYQFRSDRAGGLLNSVESESTVWFQLAFVTSPAAYIYLVREIAFRPRPVAWRIALFGLAPILMVTLSSGGRNPLFYALLACGFAYVQRRELFAASQAARKSAGRRPGRKKIFKLNALSRAIIGVLVACVAVYFARVFIVRADVVGGVDAMFGIANSSWGVNFSGPVADVLFTLLGPDLTYLVFVFTWYVVQGFVMSNTIFTSYDGPMMWSAYGVDISSAVVRRLNGDFLANGFAQLLNVNTYGFLPSAFGSLYVDFKFLALPICFIWGWLSGFVYRKVRQAQDPRWRLIAPFVIIGILLSLMNTPIGFANGLITHIWLVVAFLTARVTMRGSSPPRAMVAAAK